jgi:hypothetical protein
MARRLISCLVLVLFILQGVMQTSAAVTATASMPEHCADHDMSQDPCDCCPDDAPMAAGCLSLCSMAAAIPQVQFNIPHQAKGARHSLIVSEAFGPVYVPLKPPPIS